MSKKNWKKHKGEVIETAGVASVETTEETPLEVIEAALAAKNDAERVIEPETVPEETIAEVVGELGMEEAKAKAYAEQESTVDVVSTDPVEAAPARRGSVKRMTTHKKSEVAADKAGAEPIMIADGEAFDVERIDGMAKKVGEKAINLIAAVNGKAKLSNYTELTLRELIDKGEVTTKSLYERMREKYSEGTARSQTHQQFKLLPEFKIATLDGKAKMVLNKESVLLGKLKGVLGIGS